jgi:hypothetical protein
VALGPPGGAETVYSRLSHAVADACDPAALDRAALDLARSLIDRIEILPESDAKDAPVALVLHGRLAGILGLEQAQTRPPTGERW